MRRAEERKTQTQCLLTGLKITASVLVKRPFETDVEVGGNFASQLDELQRCKTLKETLNREALGEITNKRRI